MKTALPLAHLLGTILILATGCARTEDRAMLEAALISNQITNVIALNEQSGRETHYSGEVLRTVLSGLRTSNQVPFSSMQKFDVKGRVIFEGLPAVSGVAYFGEGVFSFKRHTFRLRATNVLASFMAEK